jgi:multisubunit Na+/H+ antiporter MnhC subunit
VSVVNTTVGGADEPIVVETHTYASLLADNATTFAQIFAFYAQAVDDTAFDALDLSIRPNTVKWSINITTASGNASSLSQQPFSVSYRLADLTATEAAAATATVVKRRGEPRANMTTYYVPLTSSGTPLVAVVEVFDVALADGTLVPLVGHDVRLASGLLSRREQAVYEYELVLEFAPFNQSLYYDPSLGLGVLLGRSDASGDGNGDDDNLALVVATSVVIPLAFVLVVGAVVVGVAVLWWRKRRANAHLQHQIDQMRDNSAL